MDETEFNNLADETLERIFDAVELVLSDEADVDIDNNTLTILFIEDGHQYLLNKHAPTQQLWLSSPASGASHYAYDTEAETWTDTRGGAALLPRLTAELKFISGEEISFD